MRKHRQERAQQQLVFGGGVDAVPLRVSALNDSTAAAPMSAWMTASQAIQFLRPRSTGAAIALPIAMPASTQASMIVNAYAVGRKNNTSIRNQIISSANDITPDTKNTHSTIAGRGF